MPLANPEFQTEQELHSVFDRQKALKFLNWEHNPTGLSEREDKPSAMMKFETGPLRGIVVLKNWLKGWRVGGDGKEGWYWSINTDRTEDLATMGPFQLDDSRSERLAFETTLTEHLEKVADRRRDRADYERVHELRFPLPPENAPNYKTAS